MKLSFDRVAEDAKPFLPYTSKPQAVSRALCQRRNAERAQASDDAVSRLSALCQRQVVFISPRDCRRQQTVRGASLSRDKAGCIQS